MTPGIAARVVRASLLAAAAGVLVSAAVTVAAYRFGPPVRLEMDRDHRAVVSGLFPPERSGGRTFAWSGTRLTLALPGADRGLPWACEASVVNWRPSSAGAATVRVSSRGRVVLTGIVTAPEEVLRFQVPAAGGHGFDLVIDVSPAFKPGPTDPRALGLAFDWIRCDPAGAGRPWPPAPAFASGALAAAILGLAAGTAGLPAGVAVLAASGGAVLLTIAGATGIAPYLSGTPPLPALAALVTVLFVTPVWLLDLGRRRVSPTARLAVVISAVACAAKLAFLLHPDKPLVDAVFHAHRFESVLAGHFYFTQLSTSATPFPYAIGLYVFAAPWSLLTADHVTLLRVVVYAAEAASGLLLYAMVARFWQSGAAGVVAVMLFHLVPLPYAVIGNANMTNAFGEAASLAVLGAITLWDVAPRRVAAVCGLVALSTLAFVSHVSVVVILSATIAVLTLARLWLVGAADRPQVRGFLLATVLGAALAVGLYWGHFGDVYAAGFQRTRVVQAPRMTAEPGGAGGTATPKTAAPSDTRRFRFEGPDLFRQAVRDAGWPISALAAVGLAWLVRERRRDRLAALVVSLGLVGVAFLTAGALAPIRDGLHQDVWEFLGRVNLAVSPATAMLAAAGAAWCWRAGVIGRVVAAALVAGALWPATRALEYWFR